MVVVGARITTMKSKEEEKCAAAHANAAANAALLSAQH